MKSYKKIPKSIKSTKKSKNKKTHKVTLNIIKLNHNTNAAG